MAAPYVVRVLALEVGYRGVTVNCILPIAIGGAGVFTGIGEDDSCRQFMTAFRPIGGRLGRVQGRGIIGPGPRFR